MAKRSAEEASAGNPSNIRLESVNPIWLDASPTERYLLLEDPETGDILMPLIYMKHVLEANYSRKLASLKHRIVNVPVDGPLAKQDGLLYWQWAFESPHAVKVIVRKEIGEATPQGHLRLVLVPIVYNALVARADLRDSSLFRALHRAMRVSTYWPLILPLPGALVAELDTTTGMPSDGLAPAPLFLGPRLLEATAIKYMFMFKDQEEMEASKRNRTTGQANIDNGVLTAALVTAGVAQPTNLVDLVQNTGAGSTVKLQSASSARMSIPADNKDAFDLQKAIAAATANNTPLGATTGGVPSRVESGSISLDVASQDGAIPMMRSTAAEAGAGGLGVAARGMNASEQGVQPSSTTGGDVPSIVAVPASGSDQPATTTALGTSGIKPGLPQQNGNTPATTAPGAVPRTASGIIDQNTRRFNPANLMEQVASMQQQLRMAMPPPSAPGSAINLVPRPHIMASSIPMQFPQRLLIQSSAGGSVDPSTADAVRQLVDMKFQDVSRELQRVKSGMVQLYTTMFNIASHQGAASLAIPLINGHGGIPMAHSDGITNTIGHIPFQPSLNNTLQSNDNNNNAANKMVQAGNGNQPVDIPSNNNTVMATQQNLNAADPSPRMVAGGAINPLPAQHSAPGALGIGQKGVAEEPPRQGPGMMSLYQQLQASGAVPAPSPSPAAEIVELAIEDEKPGAIQLAQVLTSNNPSAVLAAALHEQPAQLPTLESVVGGENDG